jgi:hypothetical protein
MKTTAYLKFVPILCHFFHETHRLFEVSISSLAFVSPGSEILRKPENNSYIENQIPTNTGLKFLTF